MTYFGASDDFADGVESKPATENSFPSFHTSVPCGTLRTNVPRGTLPRLAHSQVPRSRRRNWESQRSFQIELWVPQGKAWVSLMFHVEHLRASKENAK